MTTAPFAPKVAGLISGSLRHECTVFAVPRTGNPFPLEVEDGGLAVTFSEDWTPYAQASITAAVPAAQATLDALDPRLNCRIRIDAGYTYPDNQAEVFPLADLALQKRPVRRPSDTMDLTASSDEARNQDRRQMFAVAPNRAGVREALGWILSITFEESLYTIASDFPAGYGAGNLTDWTVLVGDDLGAAVDDLAARTGVRIFCDEARVWRITPRPELSGTPRHVLTVGPDGTITEAASDLTREGWYNAAVIRYRWRDGAGTEHEVNGTAVVTAGAYASTAVGRRVYLEDSDKPISQAVANAVAATRVRNLVTRGRSMTLTAAAAYWLRPGMTVTVELPTGGPEPALIQAITFRPLDGLMDITTRQPLNVTISTGE